MADALDWLAGHETMTISALGAVIAAGPIMATLSDMRLSSAANRLAGALMDIGVSEFDARQYERSLRSGDILIAVHSDDGESDDLALQIFDSNHASHICTTAPGHGKCRLLSRRLQSGTPMTANKAWLTCRAVDALSSQHSTNSVPTESDGRLNPACIPRAGACCFIGFLQSLGRRDEGAKIPCHSNHLGRHRPSQSCRCQTVDCAWQYSH